MKKSKLSEAKEVIRTAYESGESIESPEVMDAIYYLSEFSGKMICNIHAGCIPIREDLVQEMVIVAYKALRDKKFTFGCIQNFMQHSGIMYYYQYHKKSKDYTHISFDLIELDEVLVDDRTNDYEELVSMVQLVKRITRLAKKKLKQNMVTRTSCNLLLFPLLLCVFKSNIKLLSNYPFRTRLVLKKLVFELTEELKIYDK